MKRCRELLWNGCLAMVLAAICSGCAMLPRERISSSTTDYNLVVEKVQNEMLLLNIVRASKRRPMYFTGFNLLRGSMSYSFQTGNLTIPFGKIGSGLNGAYSIAPSVSYSASPSFDLMVWDNKEFIDGMMSPVSMDTVYYYLEQLGWHKEMLMHLLVERIETYDNGSLTASYENNPGDRERFEQFQAKLRELLKCRLVSRERYEPIGPRLRAGAIDDLEQLIQVQKAGLTLARANEGNEEWYQLSSKKTDYSYSCRAGGASEVGTYRISDNKGSRPAGNGDKQEYRMFLRSPEGVLYYLGEILRAEVEKGYVPMIEVCGSSPHVPLFVINKSPHDDGNPVISVDYEGNRYSIPGNLASGSDSSCTGDRSMHVLTFVSLLIAEQKAGMNVPVTGAVTAVGR
jgi:hypothetical protein